MPNRLFRYQSILLIFVALLANTGISAFAQTPTNWGPTLSVPDFNKDTIEKAAKSYWKKYGLKTPYIDLHPSRCEKGQIGSPRQINGRLFASSVQVNRGFKPAIELKIEKVVDKDTAFIRSYVLERNLSGGVTQKKGILFKNAEADGLFSRAQVGERWTYLGIVGVNEISKTEEGFVTVVVPVVVPKMPWAEDIRKWSVRVIQYSLFSKTKLKSRSLMRKPKRNWPKAP